MLLILKLAGALRHRWFGSGRTTIIGGWTTGFPCNCGRDRTSGVEHWII